MADDRESYHINTIQIKRMLPERPKGAFLHALFLLTLRVCLAVHDSEKKCTLTDEFLCTIGTRWASRQNIRGTHSEKSLLTNHTECMIAQTLFICYGKLPLTSACWAFDPNPELLTVFNASLIIQ